MSKGRPGTRWAFLEGLDIGADNDPYLDRLRLVQTPLFGLYLHHIHRPDREHHPHDHPWWFASIVLSGVYSELVWPDKHNSGIFTWHLRRRWSMHAMRPNSAHRIASTNGLLWTLVLTGPRVADWGFWSDGKFTSRYSLHGVNLPSHRTKSG